MTDTIDRDVELPIARASATINQCYFFDVNGVGDCGTGRSIVVGPSGYVIHEAGGGEETIPVEIDLSRVRRERAVGIRGLGQTLKSFRDRPIEFPVYQKHLGKKDYLDSLGPLIKPTRGSRSDRVAPPVEVVGGAESSVLQAAPIVSGAGGPAAGAEATPLVHAHL